MEYITLSGDGIHLDVPRRCRMIGVYSEHMAREFSFRLPIKPTPLVNLIECTIFVTFVNARGATCRQMITDWQIDGDSIVFSWTLDGRVFVTPGVVRYNIHATRRDENDHPIYEWYTTTAKAIVTEGCTYGETPEEYPPDFGPLLSETETARIALQGAIDDANTANTTLTGTTQTANDAGADLAETTHTAESVNTTLNGAISSADERIDSLNIAIPEAAEAEANLKAKTDTANLSAQTLSGLISDAQDSHAVLSSAITDSQSKKQQLDASVSSANSAKTSLDSLITASNTARFKLDASVSSANTANTTLAGVTQTANDASDDLQSYIGMAASMSGQLAEDYVLQRIVSLEDAVCTKKVTSYLRIDSESLLSADGAYAFGADDSFDYGADVILLKEKTDWMQCIVDGLMTKISDKDDIISELTERIAILEEKHENDNVYLLAD